LSTSTRLTDPVAALRRATEDVAACLTEEKAAARRCADQNFDAAHTTPPPARGLPAGPPPALPRRSV
jgi:hypothetical protein